MHLDSVMNDFDRGTELGTPAKGAPLLAMDGIDKRFPGVHALKSVSFEVRSGEVHALCGENGAGKSTLMHILAGVHQPDSGTFRWLGEENVSIVNEYAAQQLGIAIVFQERSLFKTLNVAENIFAARQPVNALGAVKWRQLLAAAQALLKEVGLEFIRPQTAMAALSPAQQQMVEIAKALSLRTRLIIFDEPTAALTATETAALFRVISRLKGQGVGVIYISHRLEEVFRIADRVTVLKDGTVQGTFPVSEITSEQLISKMVGRDLAICRTPTDDTGQKGPALLEVRNLTDAIEFRDSRPYLRDIHFTVNAREIVVLAGLAGSGRTELALSIFGARRRDSGQILLEGQSVEINSPAEAIKAGIGYASEDRKDAGLFLEMSVADNIVAACLREFGQWWFNDRRAATIAQGFAERLRISTPNVGQIVRNLSGGNQQKVALAKWLLVEPKVLIVDEPTRGIDVGAKTEVHRLLREIAAKGAAVMVISSDLPEVLAVADRVLVMREGRIAGELAGASVTEESVMRLASMAEIV